MSFIFYLSLLYGLSWLPFHSASISAFAPISGVQYPFTTRYSTAIAQYPPNPSQFVMAAGATSGTNVKLNDVWQSTDAGESFGLKTAAADFPIRDAPSLAYVYQAASWTLLLIGGGGGGGLLNDVWKSTDHGASWAQVSSDGGGGNARFAARVGAATWTTPSGSHIVIAGGRTNGSPLTTNDVWESGDGGQNWNQITASAAWGHRYLACSTVMQGNVWILYAGDNPDAGLNYADVWKSVDNGYSWSFQSSTPFTGRIGWSNCAAAGTNLYILGNRDQNDDIFNDVYISSNYGISWTTLYGNAAGSGYPPKSYGSLIGFQNTLLTFNADTGNRYIYRAIDTSMVGDPVVMGFYNQKFQVHGVSGHYYALLSACNIQINAKFVFLSSQANKVFPKIESAGIEPFVASHAGQYLNNIAIKVITSNKDNIKEKKEYRIQIIAGKWESGCSSVQINDESLSVGDIIDKQDGALRVMRRSSHLIGIESGSLKMQFGCFEGFINIENAAIDVMSQKEEQEEKNKFSIKKEIIQDNDNDDNNDNNNDNSNEISIVTDVVPHPSEDTYRCKFSPCSIWCMHGILGQTINEHRKELEGFVEDYRVNHPFDHQFLYTKYRPQP